MDFQFVFYCRIEIIHFSQVPNNFYCFLKVYSRMTNRAKYQQTIQRMQKSIQRVDHELARSRMLTHDITIDNKTDRNLDFIIKVQDQLDQQQVNKSESRVLVPQHTTYRHRISTSRQKSNGKAQNQNTRNQSFQKSSYDQRLDPQQSKSGVDQFRKYHNTQRDRDSTVRLQRKFQPFSHVSATNDENQRRESREILRQNGVQTEFDYSSPFSRLSQIKQQQIPKLQGVSEQEHIQKFFISTPEPKLPHAIQSTAQKLQSQRAEKVPLPISIFQNAEHNSSRNEEKQQNSGQNRSKDIFIQDEGMEISFSKFQQSGRLREQKKEQKQQREQKGWKVEPFSVGYHNTKKYFENSKDKESFKKAKHLERQNKLGLNVSKNKESRSKNKLSSSSKEKEKNFLSKFQIKKPNPETKNKANDLFLERKALLLQNLQKSKHNPKENIHTHPQARPSAKTYYISQFTSVKNDEKQIKRHQISPKALEISERLYSRSKGKLRPCDHYQRYSESIERQRFEQLVRQNSFVSQKMTNEEKQCVFQSLRRCDDSVSTWPMKLINYTYSKLQKTKVYKKSKNKTLA